jgi:hypothetical protein
MRREKFDKLIKASVPKFEICSWDYNLFGGKSFRGNSERITHSLNPNIKI